MGVDHEGVESRSAAREREWQLEASALAPIARWLLSPELEVAVVARPPEVHRDAYFDTPSGALAQALSSLRIRSSSGDHELTMKTTDRPPGDDGLKDRLETTESLASAVLPARGDSQIVCRALELAGSVSPNLTFELETMRQTFDVSIDGQRVAELTLDDVRDRARHECCFLRVEVETAGELDDERLLRFISDMRARFGLASATASKLETARQLSLEAIARVLPARDAAIDRRGSVGEAARIALGRNLAALVELAPGVRAGDVTAVHQARVSIRRARAAIALFRPAFAADARTVSRDLGDVARTIGPVRDLDAQLERIEGWASEYPGELREARRALLAQRDRLHTRARGAFDAPSSLAAIAAAIALLDSPAADSRFASKEIVRVAPELLRRRLRETRRAARSIGDRSGDAKLHALRITAKRLRYALEFLEPLFPAGSPAVARKVAHLQDVLGAHQDAVVARGLLSSVADSEPAAAFELGICAERYARIGGARRSQTRRLIARSLHGAYAALLRETR